MFEPICAAHVLACNETAAQQQRQAGKQSVRNARCALLGLRRRSPSPREALQGKQVAFTAIACDTNMHKRTCLLAGTAACIEQQLVLQLTCRAVMQAICSWQSENSL